MAQMAQSRQPKVDLSLVAEFFRDQLRGRIDGRIGVRKRFMLPDQILLVLPSNYLVSVVPEIDVEATNERLRGKLGGDDSSEAEYVQKAADGLTEEGFIPKRGEYEVAAFDREGEYVRPDNSHGDKVKRRLGANEVVEFVEKVHEVAVGSDS